MLRSLLDPKSSDDDTAYKEKAIFVARRFVDALDGKRYSEIWHELVADETKEVFAALAYLKHREKLATAFKMSVEDITQEFLSYALANNIEGVRTGLWAGIRKGAKRNNWLRLDVNQAQVAFLNNGALVFVPSKKTPLIIPLLAITGDGYLVDLETFMIASYTLRVNHFVIGAQQSTDVGDFQRAIRLLQDASRLTRAHGLLQQYAWQQIFTPERQEELREDSEFLLQVERLLAENKELAALDVAVALQQNEVERVEFKEQMPPAGDNDERRRLAREVAAFATSGGGCIYFGITNTKDVVGIEEAKLDSGKDEFRQRIDNMCRDNIKPTISVRVVFLPHEAPIRTVVVPVVVVPPGTEPVYYVNHKPYLRRGQSASPAEPHEVVELVRRYLAQQGWKPPE